MDFLKKDRELNFPEVKDWSDDNNHLRHAGLANLTVSQWIWFSPKAYFIIRFSPFFWIYIFSFYIALSGYVKYGPSVKVYIFTILAVVVLVKMVKLAIEPQTDMNLFDIFLRDKEND